MRSKSNLWVRTLLIWMLEMTEKEEVMRRIGKIDEIHTILDDIRRSEMTELEELEETGNT